MRSTEMAVAALVRIDGCLVDVKMDDYEWVGRGTIG